MKDIDANEIADKLGLRLVGIVAEIIATDKRLAESIAAILDEKIGKRLAEIEMTMSLIEDKDEDELPSEMVSDGDIQKISNGKYSYLYKSNCSGDIF